MALRELTSVAQTLGWLTERGVQALQTDSRRVGAGDAFIAWPGLTQDGRQYVAQALAAGARACLVEAQGCAEFEFDRDEASAPRVAKVAGLKALTGEIASAFLGHPSERLSLLAITGTNGKTSTAWWTAQALTALGHRCAMVGTLGIGEPPRIAAVAPVPVPTLEPSAAEPIRSTGLTTPDPVTLHAALKRFADRGFAACAIEASSIGLVEQRLAGTRIRAAAFTNFTQDHLNYHGSMAAYWDAKAALFAWPGLQAAVINLDDAQGVRLVDQLRGQPDTPELWTYSAVPPAPPLADQFSEPFTDQPSNGQPGKASVQPQARLQALHVGYVNGGLAFDLVERPAGRHRHGIGEIDSERAGSEPQSPTGTNSTVTVQTRLIGGFNISNLLAVIGLMRALGVPLTDAAQACAALSAVPGRMQRVAPQTECAESESDRSQLESAESAPEVVVDYAHTPDALEKALRALQPLAAERRGALWCVFGCGGNRDASKRPLMGAIAEHFAAHVVVTSDNPRNELPSSILAQIVTGMGEPQRADVIEDRREAIIWAVQRAQPHDVILVAGKGHEDHQEVGAQRLPFSDVDEARRALAHRALAQVSTSQREVHA